MKKNPRVRLVITLGIGALVVIVAVPSKKKSGTPLAPPEVTATPALDHVVAAALPGAARLNAQRLRSAQLSWGRDPFLPYGARADEPPVATATVPVSESSLPRLTGISALGAKRMAIIDHEVVQEDDRLRSGYTVERIAKDAVLLVLNESELTLKLGAEQ